MPVDQCVSKAVISLATAPLRPGRWNDIPAAPSGPAAAALAWKRRRPWPSAEIRDYYCPPGRRALSRQHLRYFNGRVL